MAIGIGEGAEIRRPMAITVISGTLVATFLTLIVIPVLYAVLDRKEFVKSPAPGAPARTGYPRGAARDGAQSGTLRSGDGPHRLRAAPSRHHAHDLRGGRGHRPGVLAAAAARAVSRCELPVHGRRRALPRVHARRNRRADHAPHRGGAGDAARHRGNSFHVQRPGRALRDPLRLGHGHQHRRLRGAHQARLGARAITEDRGPHVDVDGLDGRRSPC